MKKTSIRIQFAIIFISVLVGILFLCIIVNNIFLQRYSVGNKRKVMQNAYSKLNELFESSDGDYETEEFDVEFYDICNSNSLSVIVLDPSLEIVKSSMHDDNKVVERLYSFIFKHDPNYLFKGGQSDDAQDGSDKDDSNQDGSNRDDSKGNTDNPKDNPKVFFSENILEQNDNYIMCLSMDPRMGKEYIELMGNLDCGDIVLIRSAVESIRENAAVSNRFLAYVSLLALILGSVLIWYVATKITKPILQLADISNRMTHLDFQAKYEGRENNEIGYLGEHMNALSETLEKTISELKNANNELKDDLDKREKLDAMRSDFISNVSHELKTPIAIIQGYAEGLKDDVNEDPESREYYCEVIIDEATKMNRMVKNLITLNQLEFGSNSMNIEHFDLAELVRNFIASSRILADQAGARIEIESPENLYVWGDEYMIEEVVNNYFSNALHYLSGEKIIRVTLEQLEETARVTIFNTGANIPEEALDQIWTKFYKVDKARSREYGGSGVGLSIVKAIMESHHQKYGVENREDGVAFFFEVDCKS